MIYHYDKVSLLRASQVVIVVKNLPANEGDVREVGLIPRMGRSPAGGHSNPLQYSCLENPTKGGTWQATVYRVTQSQTWLKWLRTQCTSLSCNLFPLVQQTTSCKNFEWVLRPKFPLHPYSKRSIAKERQANSGENWILSYCSFY